MGGSPLPHLEEIWRRQEKRASLAQDYWDLAEGRPGSRVADVGSGPGYFSLRFSALTGPTGHVHAVDASDEALAFLRAKLDPFHHANVTTETLDIEKAPLPDLHFDALFITDVLHHANDMHAALRNLRLANAPLVVAEFDPAAPGDMGPPLDMRIKPDDLLRALRDTGWTTTTWQALAHEHYAIVAKPA